VSTGAGAIQYLIFQVPEKGAGIKAFPERDESGLRQHQLLCLNQTILQTSAKLGRGLRGNS